RWQRGFRYWAGSRRRRGHGDGCFRSAPARCPRRAGMKALLARNAFPLVIFAVAIVFLGLFFLWPLLKVFGASILDASGKHFTLANYTIVLSNRFFLNGLTNSLGIAA